MSTKRILLVDDDGIKLDYVGQRLESMGLAVLTARSGPEALELAQVRPPDLFVIDVRMLPVNGCELCEQIRNDPSLRTTSIVLYSAAAMTREQESKVADLDVTFVELRVGFGELLRTIGTMVGSEINEKT